MLHRFRRIRIVGDLTAADLGREVAIGGVCYTLTFVSHSMTKTRIVATWADETTDWKGDRQFSHDEPCTPKSAEEGTP